MYPPIFSVVADDAAATALLGSPPRLYPFGEAPQSVVTPYANWQVISGSPENYLHGRPDIDGFTIQVDVFGDTSSSAISAAAAIRDAIELQAHVVHWGGQTRDPDTQRYRVSFDIDWLTPR